MVEVVGLSSLGADGTLWRTLVSTLARMGTSDTRRNLTLGTSLDFIMHDFMTGTRSPLGLGPVLVPDLFASVADKGAVKLFLSGEGRLAAVEDSLAGGTRKPAS